jgi:hypothetical protein
MFRLLFYVELEFSHINRFWNLSNGTALLFVMSFAPILSKESPDKSQQDIKLAVIETGEELEELPLSAFEELLLSEELEELIEELSEELDDSEYIDWLDKSLEELESVGIISPTQAQS